MTVGDHSGSRDRNSACEPDHLDADVIQDENASCYDEFDRSAGVQGEVLGDLAVTIERDDVIHNVEHLDTAKLNDDATAQETDQNESESYPEAPDGGYAWVVCFGNFILNMIQGGLNRCEGLFFLQFQSRFQTGAQLAAWPGSLQSTINLFMGPACGVLCSRYSVRTATIIGAVGYFSSLLLTGLGPSVFFLFLSHTLLGGLGRGLLSPFLLLNLYFDRHRSLAAGLASSGVGIGTIWVVPLTQLMFDTYGFRGAFLILSGLPLNCLLCALMFRPLSLHTKWTRNDKKKLKDSVSAEEGASLTSKDYGHYVSNNQSEPILNRENFKVEIVPHLKPAAIGQDEFDKYSPSIVTDERTNNLDSRIHDVLTELHQPHQNGKTGLHCNNSKFRNSPLDSPAISPILHQRKRTKENCFKSSLKLLFPVEHKRKGVDKKRQMFHWYLLRHSPFLVFCLSNFLFVLAFKTCFTFLPAIAMSKGLSDTEAALLLTISGALDTFGRMAMGFVLDFPVLQPIRPYVFNSLLFVIAATALLIPFQESMMAYCFVCAVYGFCTGAYISQKVVVLVDLLGREVIPSSLGIQKWFQGFGTLIGPPLAGALTDALGNYDSSFYLSGASMVGAGLLMLLSNILLRLRKAQKTSDS